MSVQVMKADAVEFLTKPFRDQALLDAIHQALQRNCANRKHQAEIAEQRARYDSLTQREREVPAFVASGLLNRQIAAELGATEFTVKIQRRGVMQKDAGPDRWEFENKFPDASEAVRIDSIIDIGNLQAFVRRARNES